MSANQLAWQKCRMTLDAAEKNGWLSGRGERRIRHGGRGNASACPWHRSYCGLVPGLMMAHGDARPGHGSLPNSCKRTRNPSPSPHVHTTQEEFLDSFPWIPPHTHGTPALAAVCADNQLFMGLIKVVITINNISGESLVPEPADEAQARGDGDWSAEGAGRRRVGAERRADDAARAGGQQRRRGGHRLWIVSAEEPLHLHIRTFIHRSSYFWPRLALASRVECTLVIQTAFLEEYHHQSPTRGLVLYVFQIIEFNIWVCLEHYVIILVMV